jgi:hypothetical protein
MNFSIDVAKTMMEKIVDFKVREKALDTIRKNNAEDLIQK